MPRCPIFSDTELWCSGDVAPALGTAAACEDSTRDDMSMSAYALECYFAHILKTLEP